MVTKEQLTSAIGTAEMTGQNALFDLLVKLMDWAGAEEDVAIVAGVMTPTGGTNDVVTGLSKVLYAAVSLESAVTLTHMWSQVDVGDQAGSPASGSITIASQKPTTNLDVTPIDATTPWSQVNWIAIGEP